MSEKHEWVSDDLCLIEKTTGVKFYGTVCTDMEFLGKYMNDLINENEQLKQSHAQLKHRHSLLHDVCIDAECDRDSYRKDIVSLEKENEELNEFIDELYKKYEDAHGMSIENTGWF